MAGEPTQLFFAHRNTRGRSRLRYQTDLPNCTAKFYDLNKHPAHCPRCQFEFDQEEVVRTRRSRVRTTAPDYEDADEEAEDQVKDKAVNGRG